MFSFVESFYKAINQLKKLSKRFRRHCKFSFDIYISMCRDIWNYHYEGMFGNKYGYANTILQCLYFLTLPPVIFVNIIQLFLAPIFLFILTISMLFNGTD